MGTVGHPNSAQPVRSDGSSDSPDGTDTCPTCGGSGTIRDDNMTCPDCGGKGQLPADAELASARPLAELRLHVPAGVPLPLPPGVRMHPLAKD